MHPAPHPAPHVRAATAAAATYAPRRRLDRQGAVLSQEDEARRPARPPPVLTGHDASLPPY